jgi:FkbM family methyltransferase
MSRQRLTTLFKRVVRQSTRACGWEVRRFNPDLALDAYLPILLEKLGVNCVLDVGGYRGEYATLIRTYKYKGYIISFEPVEENFNQLQQRKDGDSMWHVYRYALGSNNETRSINVSRETDLSSFLSASDYGTRILRPYIPVERVEVVQVRRLDDVFDEVTAAIDQPRVFLKIDTQGWDLEVLRGAKGCLDQIVGLQSELSLQGIYEGMPSWTEALSEFQRANFVVSALFPLWRDSNFQLTEIDCVMVRKQ